MSVLPVVSRELRVQARRASTYWIRVMASCIAALLMLWLLFAGNAPIPSMSQGKALFFVLSILAFVYCLVAGALVTADCLSAEKRDGTIGLLFLTDLKGYDIVLGKLVSCSVHTVYGLMAAVPMMSLTLLFGGVTAGEIACTTLVLGNTLFFSLCAGILVSTLSRNDRKAVFAALFLVLVVAAGPFLVALLLAARYPGFQSLGRAEDVLTWSPVYAFSLTQNVVGLPRVSTIYSSVLQTQVISWGLLGLSCLIVPWAGQERPRGRRAESWRETWRRWSSGGDAGRARFRRRLLDRNPLFWLGSRERSRAASVWILVLPLAGLGWWIYARYWTVFYEAACVLVFTIQVLLKVWLVGEVCNRWNEDRRTGALELLNSAPLTTEDLIQGQGLALRRQFAWPVLATLALTFLAWLGIQRLNLVGSATEWGRTMLLMSLIALVADMRALRWVSTWQGLTARGLNRAIGGTLGRVLALRWVVYLGAVGFAETWQWIGNGRLPYLLEPWFWLVPALALDAIFGWSARRKFLRYFRVIAASASDYRGAAEIMADEAQGRDDRARGAGMEPLDSKTPGALSRKRRIPRWAWVTVVLVAMASVPWIHRSILEWRVERRIQALVRAGIPIRLADLEQMRPAMAKETNLAEVIQRAAPQFVKLTQLPQNLMLNIPGWSKAFPIGAEPLLPEIKAALVSLLSSNQVALAQIRALPSWRYGQYAVDWKAGDGRYAAQSQALAMLCMLLPAEILLRADEFDVTGALVATHRALDLSHSLGGASAYALRQNRSVLLDRTLSALEWMLNRCALTEPQLQELQSAWNEIVSSNHWSDSLNGVRCLVVEYYRTPPPSMVNRSGVSPPMSEVIRQQVLTQIRDWTGARDREFLAVLDQMKELDGSRDAPWSEVLQRMRRFEMAGQDLRNQSLLNRQYRFTPGLLVETWIKPSAELDARCLAAMTVVAIERYRRQDAWRTPDSLEVLVPRFLSRIPLDPFDGRPLRYRQTAKGYRVYSVGRNGTDDGGERGKTILGLMGTTSGADLIYGVDDPPQ